MKKILVVIIFFAFLGCESPRSRLSIEQPASDSLIKQKENLENLIPYSSYCNVRYEYCVDYPKGIIYPQPESQNGDGRVFKDKSGNEILRVYGSMNVDQTNGPISLGQKFDDDLRSGLEGNATDNRVITYQKLGNSFFVISGFQNGKIFYQKTILKQDAFASAILQYDEAQKSFFDKVSVRVFQSFK